MKRLMNMMFGYDTEQKKLLAFVERLARARGAKLRVLDVGCGYGRNLARFVELGYDATGVEANAAIVEANRKRGLPCVGAQDFRPSAPFDVLVFSHVIEHFAPEALVKFMDGYLDHLKEGGHALIATPLMSPYFYADFDHVKPYLPTGILMVFGNGAAQVQYYSRNKLELADLWFRRSYFRLDFFRAKYVRTACSRALTLCDLVSATAFRLSLGQLGRKDGWLGLFRKVPVQNV